MFFLSLDSWRRKRFHAVFVALASTNPNSYYLINASGYYDGMVVKTDSSSDIGPFILKSLPLSTPGIISMQLFTQASQFLSVSEIKTFYDHYLLIRNSNNLKILVKRVCGWAESWSNKDHLLGINKYFNEAKSKLAFSEDFYRYPWVKILISPNLINIDLREAWLKSTNLIGKNMSLSDLPDFSPGDEIWGQL
jgi:hypothetical protein